jgi:RNA polymerase sigma-70 factor (ECF subfamily)
MEIDIAHDESRSHADRERGFADRLTHAAPASYRIAALILGNHADAEDVVQEAAVEAWRHLRDLRDLDRFDAWFGRIVINRCRDRTRRRRAMTVLRLDDDRQSARPQDLEHVPERDALARSLSALAPEQRTVVVLRYFADLSLQDIAERTGERLGTVKSRLHYALAALRAAYDAAERIDGSLR